MRADEKPSAQRAVRLKTVRRRRGPAHRPLRSRRERPDAADEEPAMSDSNVAGPVVTDPEQHVPRARRGRAGAQRCRFCGDENAGDVVDAGGDIGRVHHACFIEWDRKEEALEMAALVVLSLPDPGERWSEREIFGEDPLAEAA
jgi:hypothetical protein